MRAYIRNALFLIYYAAYACVPSLTAAAGLPQKNDLEKTRYSRMTLPNNLKVLLVSDPDFNQSAAAMDVAAGSLSDPSGVQGLAHFLEHMLFIGTKKFPEIDGFAEYVRRNGGGYNAFTAEDHTNFHFEVVHDSLEEGLHRFSQFFIAPLFDMSYVDRERNAVHSEFEKNLLVDDWRMEQLLSSFFKKGHPANHFSIGNKDSLKAADGAALLDFHGKNYFASRMSLSILGKEPLPVLEELARKYFSAIPDKKQDRISFPQDFLESKDALRILRMIPVQDRRRLVMVFEMPESVSTFSKRPGELIAFCLGHEGEGSLLSHLRNRGLATALSSGSNSDTMDYGSFVVDIALTPKGLLSYAEVLQACFSYIGLLRKEGVPDHVFDEEKTLKKLDELFRDKGEGAGRAVNLSGKMTRYPLELAEKVDFILEEKDDRLISDFISRLEPRNMICLIMARGQPADEKEPLFGTDYCYREYRGRLYRNLLNPPAVPGLHLPAKNPFLPESVEVLSERPVVLEDSAGGRLLYLQDIEFRRPQVKFFFQALQSRNSVSVEHDVKLDFYAACVREQLRETAYPAAEAGLSYGLSADLEGLTITVEGYHDAAGRLLDALLSRMRTVSVSEETFAGIKDQLLRDLRNFPKIQAYEAARQLARGIRWKYWHSPEERLAAAEKLSLADLKSFPEDLRRHNFVRGLVHGNIGTEAARKAFASVRKALQAGSITEEKGFSQRYRAWKPGEPCLYGRELEGNNSCMHRQYYLGKDAPKTRAAARLIGNFVSQPFFTEMRTEQQLGYVVWAAVSNDRHNCHLFFVIQSEAYGPEELSGRAEKFIATLPGRLGALADVEFRRMKAAEAETLKERPKSIPERASRLAELSFQLDNDYDRVAEELRALEKISKEEVLAALNEALAPATRRMSELRLFAKGRSPEKAQKNSPALKDIRSPENYE